jgi:hypothetical protein
MAEGIGANDGFIGLNDKAGQLTDQAAGFINLGGVGVCLQPEKVVAGIYRHNNLFQGGIARPLPDAINGALHLSGAPFNRFQTIGYG